RDAAAGDRRLEEADMTLAFFTVLARDDGRVRLEDADAGDRGLHAGRAGPVRVARLEHIKVGPGDAFSVGLLVLGACRLDDLEGEPARAQRGEAGLVHVDVVRGIRENDDPVTKVSLAADTVDPRARYPLLGRPV